MLCIYYVVRVQIPQVHDGYSYEYEYIGLVLKYNGSTYMIGFETNRSIQRTLIAVIYWFTIYLKKKNE